MTTPQKYIVGLVALLAFSISGRAQDIPSDWEFEVPHIYPRSLAGLTWDMHAISSDNEGHPTQLVGANLDPHRVMGLGHLGAPNDYINADIPKWQQGNATCIYVVHQSRNYAEVERLSHSAGSNQFIEMYRVGVECFDNQTGFEQKFELYTADSGGRIIGGMRLNLVSKHRKDSVGFDGPAWVAVSKRMAEYRVQQAKQEAEDADRARHAPTRPGFISGYQGTLPPSIPSWIGRATVVLDFTVSPEGIPVNIVPETVSFPNDNNDRTGIQHQEIIEAARQALSTYRYNPSTKDGVPVSYDAKITMTLTP